MDRTTIEWTATVNPDGTVTPGGSWNPVRGCSRCSPGCARCYAETIAARFSDKGQPFHLYAERKPQAHWTGKVGIVEKHLNDPLHWKAPRKIFVNSMSDLFHEDLPYETIDRVFAVMAMCPHHTFQVLTKRPERMHRYVERLSALRMGPWEHESDRSKWIVFEDFTDKTRFLYGCQWPLRNVWLGVSVENQATADERIPLLLQTPAEIRFVSYEPALAPVDFSAWLTPKCVNCGAALGTGPKQRVIGTDAALPCGCKYCWHCADNRGRHEDHDAAGPHGSCDLDWIIVGGESGPGARPFDIAWARHVVEQCREAGVACFVKQLGARPVDSTGYADWPLTVQRYKGHYVLRDKKGGSPEEWPESLRVREFPR